MFRVFGEAGRECRGITRLSFGQAASFPDAQGRPLYLVENGQPVRELVG